MNNILYNNGKDIFIKIIKQSDLHNLNANFKYYTVFIENMNVSNMYILKTKHNLNINDFKLLLEGNFKKEIVCINTLNLISGFIKNKNEYIKSKIKVF